MTTAGQMPAVIAVLNEITSWKSHADGEYAASISEIEREEDAARRAIEEAQRQLVALAALRREVQEKHAAAAEETERRESAALREGLQTDKALLTERAAALEAAITAREAILQKQLEDPDIAAAVTEYEKFVEVEPTLAALPPSYRKAILDHHDKVRRRLEPVIQASNAGPPDLGLGVQGVGVLFAADPPDSVPEALVVVLPVPFAIYRDWAERKEDLSAQLAYRTVAAVSRCLNAVNAGAAPIQYSELHGCLAIQVWLGDCDIQGELNDRALEEIGAVREEAEELRAAGIELYGLWVRPALLAEEEG